MTRAGYIAGAGLGVASCCPNGGGAGSIGLLSICQLARSAEYIVAGTVIFGDHSPPQCQPELNALDLDVSSTLVGAELTGMREVFGFGWKNPGPENNPDLQGFKPGDGVAFLNHLADGSLMIHPSGGFFRRVGDQFIGSGGWGSGGYADGIDAGAFFQEVDAGVNATGPIPLGGKCP